MTGVSWEAISCFISMPIIRSLLTRVSNDIKDLHLAQMPHKTSHRRTKARCSWTSTLTDGRLAVRLPAAPTATWRMLRARYALLTELARIDLRGSA